MLHKLSKFSKGECLNDLVSTKMDVLGPLEGGEKNIGAPLTEQNKIAKNKSKEQKLSNRACQIEVRESNGQRKIISDNEKRVGGNCCKERLFRLISASSLLYCYSARPG